MPPQTAALEHSGAIVGYHAQLDAHSLGLTFEALIFVTMHTANRATLEAFEQAVIEIPTYYKPNDSSETPTTFCVS